MEQFRNLIKALKCLKQCGDKIPFPDKAMSASATAAPNPNSESGTTKTKQPFETKARKTAKPRQRKARGATFLDAVGGSDGQ